MKYLIDYFKFVIKKDEASEKGQAPTLKFILDFLGLTEYAEDFIVLPGKYHYSCCYCYENVRIYEAAATRADDMGFMVELSGEGCRFLEADYQERNGIAFSWFSFFQDFIYLTSQGYSLNVNRIDFAFDDYDGMLDIETIANCAYNREYVSLFRNYDAFGGGELINWAERVSIRNARGERLTGRTIYFGKRKSNAYFRFYDKKVEQMYKHRKDEEKLEQLKKIPHWVRFETEFKNKTANSIVMSMASLNSNELFSKYLAELINGYLRFIDIDDSNATRCTVKKWWAEFLGTAERSSITCPGVKKDPVKGAVTWLKNSLAPTLAAMVYRFGSEKFLEMLFEDNPEERFTIKHKQIIGEAPVEDVVDYALNSAEVWSRFLPNVVFDRLVEIQNVSVEFVNDTGEQLEI